MPIQVEPSVRSLFEENESIDCSRNDLFQNGLFLHYVSRQSP